MANRDTLPFSSLLTQEGLIVRPAASRKELEHAYRRVYWSYRKRAYVEDTPSHMRLSVFNAFPSTVTLVSILRGEVIASVTLVPDTEIGLPMDQIYSQELRGLRESGRKLVEATMFADRRNRDFRRSVPMLLVLMKHAFDYCCFIAKADDICITINPRHEDFYQEYLIFKTLGPQRAYPSVLDNPAIAKRLNLNTIKEDLRDNPTLRRLFLEDRIPPSRLRERYRLGCEDLEYFFVEMTDSFKDAPSGAVNTLKRHYPRCPWQKWGFP